jgi:hypothetical protein
MVAAYMIEDSNDWMWAGKIGRPGKNYRLR